MESTLSNLTQTGPLLVLFHVAQQDLSRCLTNTYRYVSREKGREKEQHLPQYDPAIDETEGRCS